jgi:8-oxo-dGTP pyrophosphatase MutT (NUDIX family)
MATTDKKWKRLSSEVGPDLKLFRARWDEMQNPRNEKSHKMIVLQSKDAVNVVAVSPQKTIIFVRQYRFGIEDFTLELPGGLLNHDEEVEPAAKRELREETGYVSDRWEKLGGIASNPVFMDSYIFHYLAENAQARFELELDEGEDVEIVEIPVEKVKKMLNAGEFLHPHTVNALVLYFARN